MPRRSAATRQMPVGFRPSPPHDPSVILDIMRRKIIKLNTELAELRKPKKPKPKPKPEPKPKKTNRGKFHFSRIMRDAEIENFTVRPLQNKHKDKPCFILGNGPSLDDMDMELLRNEITIGCNMIWVKEDMDYDPTYWCLADQHIAVILSDFIDRLKSTRIIRVNPRIMHSVRPNNRTYYVDTIDQVFGFSTDMARGMFTARSVVFMSLQLAYYLGCDPIYVLGCDCQPGHFRGDYYCGRRNLFTKALSGVPTWKNLTSNHGLAAKHFKQAGRRIVAVGPPGLLTAYPRISYKELHGSLVER